MSLCELDAKRLSGQVVELLSPAYLMRNVGMIVGEYVNDPFDAARARNAKACTQNAMPILLFAADKTLSLFHHIVRTIVPDGDVGRLDRYVRVVECFRDARIVNDYAYFQQEAAARQAALEDGYDLVASPIGMQFGCRGASDRILHMYFKSKARGVCVQSLGVIGARLLAIQFSLAGQCYLLMPAIEGALPLVPSTVRHAVLLGNVSDGDPWCCFGDIWTQDANLWENRKEIFRPISLAALLMCMGIDPLMLHDSWRRALTVHWTHGLVGLHNIKPIGGQA